MRTTKSLFQLCVNFICDNLQCLESLVGFPDSIGKSIFFAAFNIKPNTNGSISSPAIISGPNDYRNNLQVFFEAYGDCNILDSLSLQEDPLFLNDTIDDSWWLYQCVSQLDLAYCGLGDSHDILPQLLSSTYRLQTLILKGNTLTDEGVRKLTLRNRMFNKAVLPLETLDLSENAGITEKSLQFLNCLHKLIILDISKTSISGKAITKQRLFASWRTLSDDYERKTGCRCVTTRLTVISSGWGVQAVEMWRKQFIQVRQQKAAMRHSSRARLSIPIRDCQNSPSFYTQSNKKIAGKCAKKQTYLNLSKTNDRNILVSRNQFFCPHYSVIEFEQSGPSIERTNISAFDRDTDHIALPDGSVQKHLGIDDYLSKGSCLRKHKLETISGTCSKNVAFDTVHEDPQTLFSCDIVKKEKHESLKHTHGQSKRMNCDISGPSDPLEQAEMEGSVHSLVMEYQCCQSDLSTARRACKRSFLEVVQEYM